MNTRTMLLALGLVSVGLAAAAPARAQYYERGEGWRRHEAREEAREEARREQARREHEWREHEWREHRWREHEARERQEYYAAPRGYLPPPAYYVPAPRGY